MSQHMPSLEDKTRKRCDCHDRDAYAMIGEVETSTAPPSPPLSRGKWSRTSSQKETAAFHLSTLASLRA